MRRIDDTVFAVEQSLVALFLSAMTVMIFFEVIDRRLDDSGSKLGELFQKFGLVSAAGRPAFDSGVAPWLAAILGYLILTLGAAGAEKNNSGKRFFGKSWGKWVAGAIAFLLCVLVFYLMNATSSRNVYFLVGGLSLAAFVRSQWQEKHEGWMFRTGISLFVVAPIFVWFANTYFGNGYGWSKEISRMLTLWVGFFGASVCVHEGKHIRIEALEKTWPKKYAHYVAAAGYVLVGVFSLFLAYLGFRYVFVGEGSSYQLGDTLELTGVPSWIMNVALPIAFGITAIRFFAAAVSSIMGGNYGAAAKGEGIEEAERLAAESGVAVAVGEQKKQKPIFYVFGAIALLMPFVLGKAGVLISVILIGAMLALPLFALLGLIVITCFTLWAGFSDPHQFQSPLVERMRELADKEALLAIPLFIMSGAVMGHGQISQKLINFARACVGWMPGGLAVSAVMACMFFAAISGSSPATVVAIGGSMAPALIAAGYQPSFAHGLVTSAGSLGILIPPSIPMIVYALVNQTTPIRVEELFAAGYGPGLVIGGILMGYSIYRGKLDKTPRDTFTWRQVYQAAVDGFWALMFPVIIMGGITFGVYNAIEAACISVVYAVVVEVFVHRAIKISDIPKVFAEVGVMLGSFLVILVISQGFTEFLEEKSVPHLAVEWIQGRGYTRGEFLLALNLLLLVVGCLMDIMSAILVFVPLIAPMAHALGIDPLHLGIVFIVNLEIGYLTPPIGMNLFVASTLFGKPMGYMVRAVLPFIILMMGGLIVITYVPSLSGDFGRWILGVDNAQTITQTPVDNDGEHEANENAPTAPAANGNVMTMEQMMQQATDEGEAGGEPVVPVPTVPE